jgi:D-amino peptidase
MGDLAAVINGLHEAGINDITVLDGHGSQVIIPHLMVPGAKYVTGKPRPGAGNLSELDSTFAGMILLGFHAMMGTTDGVLHHTQSSKTENRYWYNGTESGEIAQNAAIAGYYGVPVIMVTGDEAVCREARKFFGNSIVTVAVKKGLSREAAVLYPFEETRKALFDGAKKAVSAIPSCKPYILKTPVKIRETFLGTVSGTEKQQVITREGEAPDALHILNWKTK